jgi:hypothetical protein
MTRRHNRRRPLAHTLRAASTVAMFTDLDPAHLCQDGGRWVVMPEALVAVVRRSTPDIGKHPPTGGDRGRLRIIATK